LLIATALASAASVTVTVLGTAPVAAASAESRGRVDVRFSESVHGTMTTSLTPPRCTSTSAASRVVTLDGKVGANEYVVSMYLRGPQTAGPFPIGSSDNQSVVTVQKVGTKSSPTTAMFAANGGAVVAKTATSGSVDAQLVLAGRDPQPLRVHGSWACAVKRAKKHR
jgi:hypothetical protein